jgi:hypothetical protein
MVLRRKSRLAGFSLVFAWLGICLFSLVNERVSYAIEEQLRGGQRVSAGFAFW